MKAKKPPKGEIGQFKEKMKDTKVLTSTQVLASGTLKDSLSKED